MNSLFRYFLYCFITINLVSCDAMKRFFRRDQKPQKLNNNVTKKEDRSMSWAQKNLNFLEENRSKSGVKVTSSGLQYKVIKEGQGDSPKATSQVEVHYKGTLIDGSEFDSSYKRNQTATFGLNQVISGWTEGVQLMNEGAVYEFYIPSSLGYGNRDIPSIPAASTLIFQVELVKIVRL